ncbi:MAG: DUF790 family protein [Magnetococcales bacterium]|nr:DUF790 family protein [Magnetococcales bacterium]
MLTKDLLRHSRHRDRIFPRTLDVNNRSLQTLASNLIEVFSTGVDLTQEQINELTHPLITAYRSPVIARGLEKLLKDRCTFREPDKERIHHRAKVFEAAALCFQKEDADDLPTFRKQVAEATNADDPDELAATLYDDLPSRLPLEAFKPITDTQLLHRYNMAQAQGLLIWAEKVTISLQDPDVGRRRQLLRRLRFLQLLASVRMEGEERVEMELDGPLSILQNTQKYGLQLAQFLPAICWMDRWMLRAEIKMRGAQAGYIELDQDLGLRSHYAVSSSYRPEEFKALEAQFRDDVAHWKILEESPILDLGRQQISIPDLSFRHKSRRLAHLELFHRWHKGPLLQRLDRLEARKGRIPLILGVDRFLGKDDEVKARLEASPWFETHGFWFNAFPTVKRLVGVLDTLLK